MSQTIQKYNANSLNNRYPNLTDPFLGFERLFNEFNNFSNVKSVTFPPYDIKKVDEFNYLIEIAVAGFTRDDIDITINDNKLLVKGSKTSDDSYQYIHKGIANRNFERQFVLADTIEVVQAKMENGMLFITLKNNIPENKLPRSIKIS